MKAANGFHRVRIVLSMGWIFAQGVAVRKDARSSRRAAWCRPWEVERSG